MIYKDEASIRKSFNTTVLKKFDNQIQVCHWKTGMYHYFQQVANGWQELSMTSISSEFFLQGAE